MSLESNMMIAAEACFEMDPSPAHEAWFNRNFIHIYDTPTSKNDPFTHSKHNKI